MIACVPASKTMDVHDAFAKVNATDAKEEDAQAVRGEAGPPPREPRGS